MPTSAPAAVPTADTDERVEAEMTQLLYRSAGFGLFSNFVLALVLVAGTFSVYPLSLQLGWLAAILGISAARFGLNLRFARRKPEGRALAAWRIAFVVGVAAAGLVWGAAGFLFFTEEAMLPRLLVLLILAGLTSGAARSLASVPVAYTTYVASALTPLFVTLLLTPEPHGVVVALTVLTYALFLINTARLHHADLRRMWRLIFENEALVGTLRDAKLQAEAASRAKSDFLATMSHEIRTPMNGIMGMLQILHHSPLAAQQKQQIEVAWGSADTLMRLLNDVLDFSKIESGKLQFESLPFSIHAAVDEVVALLRVRATEKRLQFNVELDPQMPSMLIGDVVRLKQVLLNLIGNAIKFTENGYVALAVELAGHDTKGARLRFRVRDTGIGMDAVTRRKLFQPFAQGDSSTTRRFGGTGLGLAISQRLVQQMGGEIVAESTPGTGSEFNFELPMLVAHVSHLPAAASSENNLPRLTGRLLVAEDDRVNQRVIELLLEQLGIQPTIVTDGEAAVEVATLEQWDAVLMDCQMPGVDGFEATRRIRKRLAGKPLPIIAITANAMAGDREACLAAGMNDFVPKPIRKDELRATLQRWLPAAASAAAVED